MNKYYLAIDIGASSGRHIIGWVEDGKMKLKEIYRFENRQLQKNGHLIWDMDNLWNGIIDGLKACKGQNMIPETVGIDTWGVDYVLLDENGDTLGDPIAYRDRRTEGMDEVVVSIINEKELYEKDLYEKDLTGNEDAEVSGTPSGRYRKPFTPLKDLLHPDSGTGREKKKSSPVPAVGLCILLAALLLNSDSGSRTLLLILLAVISLIALYTAGAILQRYPAKELVSAAGTVMAPIIALAIVVIYPVSDMWYYLGALVSLLGSGLGIIGILRKYNDQAMRPLPDFVHREGGDNRA